MFDTVMNCLCHGYVIVLCMLGLTCDYVGLCVCLCVLCVIEKQMKNGKTKKKGYLKKFCQK